jgi:hypothetical protein
MFGKTKLDLTNDANPASTFQLFNANVEIIQLGANSDNFCILVAFESRPFMKQYPLGLLV